MTFALAVSHEGFIAARELTLEILDIGMDSFVDAQVATLTEALGALVALVRLLACVFPDVRLQGVVPGEASLANVASKRPLLGVDAFVVFQVSLRCETLDAAVFGT